jgi:hypothetical protein
MARINNCPEPVRRTGGAAPKCVACAVSEDFCYRLATDSASVTRAGKHTYDIDEMCVRTNEKWLGDDGAEIDRCTVPLTVLLCGGGGGGGGGGVPPEDVCPCPGVTPLTLDGEDCDGAPVAVSGFVGTHQTVVQAAGTVFKVQLCPGAGADAELIKRCDPVTGEEILFQWDVATNPPTLVSATNLATGAAFTGDATTLVSCGGSGLESDAELFCDSGVEFLRWFVKKDGVPTGVKYDTDLSGVTYVVTDAAAVTLGSCTAATACNPTISSAPADTLAGLLPGTSISIQKAACCSLKVTTSAGSFIVSKEVTGYSTGDFKCAVTVTAVEILSGTCDLADVIVTTQFTG